MRKQKNIILNNRRGPVLSGELTHSIENIWSNVTLFCHTLLLYATQIILMAVRRSQCQWSGNGHHWVRSLSKSSRTSSNLIKCFFLWSYITLSFKKNKYYFCLWKSGQYWALCHSIDWFGKLCCDRRTAAFYFTLVLESLFLYLTAYHAYELFQDC